MSRIPFCMCLTLATGVSFAGTIYTRGDVFASVGNGLVREFTPTGTLVQTLNTGTNSTFTAGGAFDSSGDFFVTTFGSNVVSKFDNSGNLINGSFAAGFNSDPESISFGQSGNFFVGEADGTHQVSEFTSGGMTGTPVASFSPATQDRGTDWVDLAADQQTIYYTSEGTTVKRFNTATSTQLTDLNSVALPGSNAFALRILSNGGVLVADTNQIVQLDSTGAIVKQYTAANTFSGRTLSTLFALNLDPDGTTFWTGDLGTNTIYHVDIATGALINSFSAGTGTLGGLTVFGEITQGVPTTTPEPSTFLLGGLGVAVWWRVSKRRLKA